MKRHVRAAHRPEVALRVISIAVAIVLLIGLAGCGSSKVEGPVHYTRGVVYFPHANVGDVFTDGSVQLVVEKDRGTPVIDAVRSVNTSPGLRLLGVRAAGQHRRPN